jgi:hypothetical protein
MEKFKRIALVSLISVVLIGLIIGSIFLFGNYSDGQRVGQVVKFSRKGVLIKTWEGQVNVGGFAKDAEGDISPNVWSFSVYPGDKEIQDAIYKSMEKGSKVRLFYKEKFVRIGLLGDTKYFITKVEYTEE